MVDSAFLLLYPVIPRKFQDAFAVRGKRYAVVVSAGRDLLLICCWAVERTRRRISSTTEEVKVEPTLSILHRSKETHV
jgi:hypothetical protein